VTVFQLIGLIDLARSNLQAEKESEDLPALSIGPRADELEYCVPPLHVCTVLSHVDFMGLCGIHKTTSAA